MSQHTRMSLINSKEREEKEKNLKSMAFIISKRYTNFNGV